MTTRSSGRGGLETRLGSEEGKVMGSGLLEYVTEERSGIFQRSRVFGWQHDDRNVLLMLGGLHNKHAA
jgi:hypothetical protein